MSGRLPREIDPIRLADEGRRLQGELPGAELTRLTALAPASEKPAPVSVDLTFGRSSRGERWMRGSVRTHVVATCQRCLGPMSIALEASPMRVLRGPGGTGDGREEDAESLVVEGPVNLRELVEEELLLAMPMIPMHGENECKPPVAARSPAGAGRPNRFAALRDRRGKD
jgi:uncharacterized protein